MHGKPRHLDSFCVLFQNVPCATTMVDIIRKEHLLQLMGIESLGPV